jgi:hypothetical protein
MQMQHVLHVMSAREGYWARQRAQAKRLGHSGRAWLRDLDIKQQHEQDYLKRWLFGSSEGKKLHEHVLRQRMVSTLLGLSFRITMAAFLLYMGGLDVSRNFLGFLAVFTAWLAYLTFPTSRHNNTPLSDQLDRIIKDDGRKMNEDEEDKLDWFTWIWGDLKVELGWLRHDHLPYI